MAKPSITKRVFVIGAGMSADCGAPLLSQFLEPPFTGYIKKNRWNSLRSFISSVYPANAKPNVEEILSLVDNSIANRVSIGGYNTEGLQNIRRNIVDAIVEIFVKVENKLSKQLFGTNRRSNPYAMTLARTLEEREQIMSRTHAEEDRFLFGLSEHNDKVHGDDEILGDRDLGDLEKGFKNTYILLSNILCSSETIDTVINFNYELFLEDVLIPMADSAQLSTHGQLAVHVDYGIDRWEFVPDRDHYSFEGRPLGFLRSPPTPMPLFKDSGTIIKTILLLKLHGAINWSTCSSCRSLITTVLTPISDFRSYIRQIQHLPIEAKRELPLCCPEFDPEPLIVPPTWMKDYHNRCLEDVWQAAVVKLSEADEIIFLGYSFAESDYQIRNALNRAWAMRKGRPWKTTVVDIGGDRGIEKVQHVYGKFFGDVEPYAEGVSDYLKTHFKELKSC